MGLRETLNENPRITTGVTVGIIVVILALILWPSGGGGAGGGAIATKAFYTIDDGKTWFADDSKKVPPFKKDGKDAYRAIVYKCGGKTFVNHMERFTPDAQKKLEALYAKGGAIANDPSMVGPINDAGLEVKAPGGKEWVKMIDPKAASVMRPNCPDGATDIENVMP